MSIDHKKIFMEISVLLFDIFYSNFIKIFHMETEKTFSAREEKILSARRMIFRRAKK